MKSGAAWLWLILFAAVLCWFFPAFHLLPLGRTAAPAGKNDFNAQAFAAEFWEAKLIPASEKAADIGSLLAALQKSPKEARMRFGHSPGMSSTTFFFVKGSGDVVAVGEDGVSIKISPEAKEPEILLHTGLLFGNTVRDGTGLIDPSQFPNSQHFNDISTELNRIVETNVIPRLRGIAVPAKKLSFLGCAELEEDEAPRPLKVVPVKVE
jgi:predicted lipoprotein